MPPMPKVDLFAAIRRDSHAGMSVRTMASKYQVSRPRGIAAAAAATILADRPGDLPTATLALLSRPCGPSHSSLRCAQPSTG
jgi:hypothetical protein